MFDGVITTAVPPSSPIANCPLKDGRGATASIAVVGSGIAGLSAAWLLSKDYNVTVFEAGDYIGGHSNTVDVPTTEGEVAVDTGFIVYNEKNYPNLTALFAHLGIETEPSDMSFSVSVDDGRIEYAGARRLKGLFAQRRNLVRPEFWRMLSDVRRFYRDMRGRGDDAALADMTLGDVLTLNGYSTVFRDHHLLPMAAAIWSGPVAAMMDFPAQSFIRFCDNHGLLQVGQRPAWRTVSGGSREYVRRLAQDVSGPIHLNRPVRSVARRQDGVLIETDFGIERFDHCVIGAHADQALALLDDASAEERRVLGAFPYQRNEAILHCDASLMPRRPGAWASWNYRSDRHIDPTAPVSVTYWMNRLQNLDPRHPIFLTLNTTSDPAPDKTIARFAYDHPLFDIGALTAQKEIQAIQGMNRTWFCGSYCGFGFHEDGLVAGIQTARGLGANVPWETGKTPVAPSRVPILQQAA